MLKGKVQMGTDATTFARWHQDSLDDCSPEDRVWGWSIRSTEVIHYDRIKFDDECLRKMLLQGRCDTAEGAPAWTERVSAKEGIRFMSLVATRIFQKFIRLNDKIGILDASIDEADRMSLRSHPWSLHRIASSTSRRRLSQRWTVI